MVKMQNTIFQCSLFGLDMLGYVRLTLVKGTRGPKSCFALLCPKQSVVFHWNWYYKVLVLFLTASLGLTSTTKGGARGSFIGYSATGLPLYNFTNSALRQTSQSILMQVTSFLKQILTDHNSRRIFYFLCLNLSKFDHWIFPVLYLPSFAMQKGRYTISPETEKSKEIKIWNQ